MTDRTLASDSTKGAPHGSAVGASSIFHEHSEAGPMPAPAVPQPNLLTLNPLRSAMYILVTGARFIGGYL